MAPAYWFAIAAALALLAGLSWRFIRTDGPGTVRGHPPSRPLPTHAGIWVVSRGEQRIANWLSRRGLAFRYEPELAGGLTPDFHLEGTQVVIEYWGLASEPSYEDRMVEKIEQYEAHGFSVVSIFPAHLHEIEDVLERELEARGVL